MSEKLSEYLRKKGEARKQVRARDSVVDHGPLDRQKRSQKTKEGPKRDDMLYPAPKGGAARDRMRNIRCATLLRALDKGFMFDDALTLAGMSEATFRQYCLEVEDLEEKCFRAGKRILEKAYKCVEESIDKGNSTVAMWYLEKMDIRMKPRRELRVSEERVVTAEKVEEWLENMSPETRAMVTADAVRQIEEERRREGREIIDADAEVM